MDLLIVDDDPYIQRSLSFVFRKEGFDLEVATNGREALSTTRELRPKIIFLDLMMPKMNGFETCRAIKEDPDLRNCYVIVLTAKGQEIDKEMGLMAGADEYITKPFSPKEIVRKVRTILSRE